MIKKLFKNRRGDTIVEVTLALTVLALVLGTSSVLANRNTKTLQNAQEKNVAVRYAQQQIEFLKTKAVGDMAVFTPYVGGAKFCMTNADSAPVALTDTSCRVENGGAKYVQTITLESVAGETGVYNAKANVEWETLTSWMDSSGNIQNKGKAQLTYRIYSKLGAHKSPTESACGLGYVWNVAESRCVPAPSLTFSANRTNILQGENVYLSWQAQNVTSCEASGVWSGARAIIGGQYVAPASDASYTIRCSGLGGLISRTVSITVEPARQAIYRCYQFYHYTGNYRLHTNHHYSTNRNFCDGNGYGSGVYEGIMGYAPMSSNSGAVPVYSSYSPGYADTFYTTSSWEYNQSLSQAHTSAGGVVFYVYPYNGGCSVRGTVPVYRHWSDFVGNHMYTTNPAENGNSYAAVDGGGTFTYESVLGCVFRNER